MIDGQQDNAAPVYLYLELGSLKGMCKYLFHEISFVEFLCASRILPPVLSCLFDGMAENRPVLSSEALSLHASSLVLCSQDSVMIAILMLLLKR